MNEPKILDDKFFGNFLGLIWFSLYRERGYITKMWGFLVIGLLWAK